MNLMMLLEMAAEAMGDRIALGSRSEGLSYNQLFATGTTGQPKSAILRHSHLVSYIVGTVEFMGADEDEATLVSVPPYHMAGVASMLSSVNAGRRIVQLPTFDADHWIDTVLREGITHAMVVPTMLARIVDALDARGGEALLGVRTLAYGGGRMPLPVIRPALELSPTSRQRSSVRHCGGDLRPRHPGCRRIPGEGLDAHRRLVPHPRQRLHRRARLPVPEGRNDDVIVRGGENISPVVIVMAKGETPSGSELRDHVRVRLGSSRVPAHVVIVDELPYNDTDKLLRRVLRADCSHLGDDPTT